MKQIPEDFLVKIRSIPITDVAEQYFDLKKIGSIYQTTCIHEGDRTPSLTFFPDTNTFYCFGCGAGKRPQTEGSDVISFVMWLDKCSFTEAVAKLAFMQGWSVPRDVFSEEDQKKQKLLDEVLETNRKYWAALQSQPDVMNYLMSRGITQEDIQKWRIGFVPIEEGFYGGRLTFAIMNHWGRTVGFSYRNMSDVLGIPDDKPKYINSPNSLIFDKGSILYGLNFVKRLIREKGYVVIGEGYTDTILAQKYGLPFVGLMGTSLTQTQIRLLKQYTDTVILWLDGDNGGISASIRHGRELMKNGFLVKVVSFAGQDPDDVILKFRASEEYPTLEDYMMKHSYLAPYFEMDMILKRYDSDLLELKVKAIQQIESILQDMKGVSHLDPYIHYVARRLDISVDSLLKGVKKDDNGTNRSRNPWVNEARKLAVQG